MAGYHNIVLGFAEQFIAAQKSLKMHLHRHPVESARFALIGLLLLAQTPFQKEISSSFSVLLLPTRHVNIFLIGQHQFNFNSSLHSVT